MEDFSVRLIVEYGLLLIFAVSTEKVWTNYWLLGIIY